MRRQKYLMEMAKTKNLEILEMFEILQSLHTYMISSENSRIFSAIQFILRIFPFEIIFLPL